MAKYKTEPLVVTEEERRQTEESLKNGTFRFPGIIGTDTNFLYAGRRESDIDGKLQRWRIQQAEAAGVSTTGKFYISGLASYPGDPTAWVSDTSDVRRVAREKNMKVEGMVEQDYYRDDPPPAPVKIGEDILERRVKEALTLNPEAKVEDVRERERALASGEIDLHPEPLVTDHDFGLEL